jgi:uncharacterized FlaG/YvyC family protein
MGGGVRARPIDKPVQKEAPDRSGEVRDAGARDERPDTESLKKLSEKIEFNGRTAEFSYDNKLDVVVVKIYSSQTEPREIVRQIPPEEFLTFQARYRELLGLLFDEQA